MLRRLLWPALTTALMLAVTLSLGVWQVHRLTWKTALLADIDRGERLQPVPLNGTPPAFRRVTVTGHYLPETARYGTEVRATRDGAALGSQLLCALQPASGEPVIVDRGWAPDSLTPSVPSGTVTVEGYVRPPEYPVRFGAADDPVARRFYALDPAAIASALGLRQAAPFTLVLLGPPGSIPEPATALPRPPNDHLSYAITWFGLSAALLAVFGVYAGQLARRARTEG